jgi:beta-glucosidase
VVQSSLFSRAIAVGMGLTLATFPAGEAAAAPADGAGAVGQRIFTRQSAEARQIVKRMSLDEKVGQMTLAPLAMIDLDNASRSVRRARLGAVLPDANWIPAGGPDMSSWRGVARSVSARPVAAGGRRIGLLLGTDAVHGNQHVTSSVLFPHNIGLGATRSASAVNAGAAWTGYSARRSGFNWIYAPTVAVAHDYRWGRTYESFSRDPARVERLGRAFVTGAQAIRKGSIRGALATAKHFIGDGDTAQGVDEGNAIVTDMPAFLRDNYPGYRGAIAAGVGSVMASYSQINGLPMHLNRNQLTNVLKRGRGGVPGQQPFAGFVVSDFGGVDKAATLAGISYPQALARAINAGIDMVMLSQFSTGNYKSIAAFQRILARHVRAGRIPMARINDAVKRILRVKLAMGLVQSKRKRASTAGSPPAAPRPRGTAVDVARSAAAQSLVLLKNDGDTLPVPARRVKKVILLGSHIDDIGSQSGGWTVTWQGQPGNTFWSGTFADSKATSLADGLQDVYGIGVAGGAFAFRQPSAEFLRDQLLGGAISAKDTIAVVAIGELPYAEWAGDRDNNNPLYPKFCQAIPTVPCTQSNRTDLEYDSATLAAIHALRESGVKVITVLFSGRPLVITRTPSGAPNPDAPLNQSDAVIAAFLPSTTGGRALANAISGVYRFRAGGANRLPFAWPDSQAQIQDPAALEASPLFPRGFGLSTR